MAPASSSTILPALSIALGLPLCRRDTSSVTEDASPSSSDLTAHQKDLKHAERVKNSVSRIYARKMIDRAELERSHPWRGYSTSSDKCGRTASSSKKHSKQYQRAKHHKGNTDKLLIEALSSLINVKYSNFTPIQPTLSLMNTSVAACESFTFPSGTKHDAKDRTLNAYNNLATNEGAIKPKEWADDVDLEQRRAEFGQKISPLSNTSRLERWGMAAKRMGTLGILASPLGVLVPLNWIIGSLSGDSKNSNPEGDKTALQAYHDRLTQKTWDYALWAIETAGPTYIKLAQWASTRNDLFSPEFVGYFSKLQDETRGHSWKETEAALERAYGKEWRKVLSFDKFEEDHSGDLEDNKRFKGSGDKANRDRQKRLERNETKSASSAASPTIPIGSGCVAQVYKARLRQSHGLHPAGTSVAVKVQHPRILEKVCLDFYLMNKFACEFHVQIQ